MFESYTGVFPVFSVQPLGGDVGDRRYRGSSRFQAIYLHEDLNWKTYRFTRKIFVSSCCTRWNRVVQDLGKIIGTTFAYWPIMLMMI